MEPHGDYKIEIIGRVVHVFPVGGFNEQGIIQLHKDIISIAPIERPWVLFEHPKNVAGLTPEAIEELTKSYQKLSQVNCVAAALEISSTWQGIFENSIANIITIPVYLNSDVSTLDLLIKQKLENI